MTSSSSLPRDLHFHHSEVADLEAVLLDPDPGYASVVVAAAGFVGAVVEFVAGVAAAEVAVAVAAGETAVSAVVVVAAAAAEQGASGTAD